MNLVFKKTRTYLLVYIPLLLLNLAFISLITFLLIYKFSVLNLIFLIIFSLFFLLILISFVLYLHSFSFNLYLKDNSIQYKDKSIFYNDIFYSFSSSFKDTLILYLNNGEIFKIKYLEHVNEISKLMLIKIKKEHFIMYRENKFKKFFHRLIQYFINFISHFIIFKHSKVLKDFKELALTYQNKSKKKIFIVVSNYIYKNNLLDPILNELENLNIHYYLYSLKITNPTDEDVLKAKNKYLEHNCDSLLSVGGGSIIDLSKALGVVLTNKKPLIKYKGLFKVRKKIPFLIAIPSTCGTGSETTLASVITINHHKIPIESNKITPSYTYLGKEFISSLPPSLVAETALDALTHALESYLNAPRYKKYEDIAIEAIKLINDNLLKAYTFNDIESKEKLLYASFLAGKAFNTKMVGYVHALSHALSGKFNLPHGRTNSIILPYCLKIYLFNKKANKKMRYLSYILNLSSSKNDLDGGLKFVNYIDELISKVGIDRILPKEINDSIEELAKNAYKESVPLYPCPIDFTYKDFIAMYLNMKKY